MSPKLVLAAICCCLYTVIPYMSPVLIDWNTGLHESVSVSTLLVSPSFPAVREPQRLEVISEIIWQQDKGLMDTSSPQTGSGIYQSLSPHLPTQYQVVVMDRSSAELAKHVPEKAAVSNYRISEILVLHENKGDLFHTCWIDFFNYHFLTHTHTHTLQEGQSGGVCFRSLFEGALSIMK